MGFLSCRSDLQSLLGVSSPEKALLLVCFWGCFGWVIQGSDTNMGVSEVSPLAGGTAASHAAWRDGETVCAPFCVTLAMCVASARGCLYQTMGCANPSAELGQGLSQCSRLTGWG
jgi:hypothetical protein